MIAPPVLLDDFPAAMLRLFWCGDKADLSTRVYYFWAKRYQPIEDEV